MIVEIKRATRKDLDDMCRSMEMSSTEINVMVNWYYQSSDVWAGFWRGHLACVYGVHSPSLMSETAYLWLATNELVTEHPFLFVRHSQLVVQKLLQEYKTIHGHVHARSPNSIRWLEWLGVKLKRHKVENDLIPFDLERSG